MLYKAGVFYGRVGLQLGPTGVGAITSPQATVSPYTGECAPRADKVIE